MILTTVSFKMNIGAGRPSVLKSPCKYSGLQQTLPLQGKEERKKRGPQRSRGFMQNKVIFASSYRDPYDTLGVKRSASLKEVKQAYRKKALKLHPDVNKAPDAKERFMECKNAYQEIIDGRKEPFTGTNRAKPGWSRQRADSGQSPTPGSKQESKPEEFYGLGDLFRDLENEWKNKSKNSNEPKDLWEELADIGEEFVEFLEKGIGISEEANTSSKGKWDGSAEQVSASRNPDTKGNQAAPKRRDVDEELEELKRKMGL